MLMKFPM